METQDQLAFARYEALARTARLDTRLAEAFENLTTGQLDTLVARLVEGRPSVAPAPGGAAARASAPKPAAPKPVPAAPAPTGRRRRLSENARTVVLAVVAFVVSVAGVVGASLAIAESDGTATDPGTAQVLDVTAFDAALWDY